MPNKTRQIHFQDPQVWDCTTYRLYRIILSTSVPPQGGYPLYKTIGFLEPNDPDFIQLIPRGIIGGWFSFFRCKHTVGWNLPSTTFCSKNTPVSMPRFKPVKSNSHYFGVVDPQRKGWWEKWWYASQIFWQQNEESDDLGKICQRCAKRGKLPILCPVMAPCSLLFLRSAMRKLKASKLRNSLGSMWVANLFLLKLIGNGLETKNKTDSCNIFRQDSFSFSSWFSSQKKRRQICPSLFFAAGAQEKPWKCKACFGTDNTLVFARPRWRICHLDWQKMEEFSDGFGLPASKSSLPVFSRFAKSDRIHQCLCSLRNGFETEKRIYAKNKRQDSFSFSSWFSSQKKDASKFVHLCSLLLGRKRKAMEM